jgi:hypothetical protein
VKKISMVFEKYSKRFPAWHLLLLNFAGCHLVYDFYALLSNISIKRKKKQYTFHSSLSNIVKPCWMSPPSSCPFHLKNHKKKKKAVHFPFFTFL